MIRMFKIIRGGLGGLALFLSSYFGCLFFLCPALPLAFIPSLHVVYRYYVDFFIYSWVTFATAIMRIYFGVDIVTHGDYILPADKALIVMNHRTRLDWFYFWSTMITDFSLYDLKIALKKPLARIPGAGWSMQIGSFLFLNRRAEIDLPRISKYLKYLSGFRDRQFKLLLFPEGTDYCRASKAKSDSFADKHNLCRYEFVLHPRTTGIDMAYKTLTELKYLDAVYDVTVAYGSSFPESELALLSSDLPTKVHFFVKRYSAEEVANIGPSKFWLNIWKNKENFLQSFYEGKLEDKIKSGRSECLYASSLEYFALFFWSIFILYSVFVILPLYWPIVLFLTLALKVWSDILPNSIDDAIVNLKIR